MPSTHDSSGENACSIYALYWMDPTVVLVEEMHIHSMQLGDFFLGRRLSGKWLVYTLALTAVLTGDGLGGLYC